MNTCTLCGFELREQDESGLCGFCKLELELTPEPSPRGQSPRHAPIRDGELPEHIEFHGQPK